MLAPGDRPSDAHRMQVAVRFAQNVPSELSTMAVSVQNVQGINELAPRLDVLQAGQIAPDGLASSSATRSVQSRVARLVAGDLRLRILVKVVPEAFEPHAGGLRPVSELVHQFSVATESAPCEVGAADPSDCTLLPTKSIRLRMEPPALGCPPYAQLYILGLHQASQRRRVSRSSREAHRYPYLGPPRMQKKPLHGGARPHKRLVVCVDHDATAPPRRSVSCGSLRRDGQPLWSGWLGLVEVGCQLGPASPRRIGELLGDLMPLAERLRQRQGRCNGVCDLMQHELKVTPGAARPRPLPRGIPRGKWRSRGESASRPAGPPRACRRARPWHCRRPAWAGARVALGT